jgi:hypothetical protein
MAASEAHHDPQKQKSEWESVQKPHISGAGGANVIEKVTLRGVP